MLCDEVSCAGVQGAGKEGGENKVDERFCAEGRDEEVVEEELGGDIE